MSKPTEYTFTRADGSKAFHIVDPDAGLTVMQQIGMFTLMERAISARPTTEED